MLPLSLVFWCVLLFLLFRRALYSLLARFKFSLRNSAIQGMDRPEDYEISPYTGAMADSVRAVERILNYPFTNKRLLEEALTHSSYTESASYQRLEFLGDSALGLAIINFLFRSYPDLGPGQLSLLRSANTSTEKLARVAVRRGLHRYVRHNPTGFDDEVRDFALAVEKEDATVVYGGLVKAPKVLADIVESVAAAVYVDCQFDLQALWEIFRGLLEPIVTLDVLQQQPQPVTMLFELCQKNGTQLDIEFSKEGEMNIASVYVDRTFIASASSKQKENAKLHAAEAALAKLCNSKSNDQVSDVFTSTTEIDGAKQKLHELCVKRRWPKPSYEIKKEIGPSHERKYICSVRIKTAAKVMYAEGDEKSRVREAENSAALSMICGMLESKNV